MESQVNGRSAPIPAEDALRVAAWRRLWRLLLQPTGDRPGKFEAAPDQGAAQSEEHDASVQPRP